MLRLIHLALVYFRVVRDGKTPATGHTKRRKPPAVLRNLTPLSSPSPTPNLPLKKNVPTSLQTCTCKGRTLRAPRSRYRINRNPLSTDGKIKAVARIFRRA